jgi:hypothetical protein
MPQARIVVGPFHMCVGNDWLVYYGLQAKVLQFVAHVSTCKGPAMALVVLLGLRKDVLQARAPPFSGHRWVPL